jgi:hypothetical protein
MRTLYLEMEKLSPVDGSAVPSAVYVTIQMLAFLSVCMALNYASLNPETMSCRNVVWPLPRASMLHSSPLNLYGDKAADIES